MPINLPEHLTAMHPVPGVRLAAVAAGIKASGPDLMLIEIAPGAQCAAVFTRNAFCAAPVIVARRHLATVAPRYLLVNAGNANAGTGAAGLRDADACCQALAELAGCRREQVVPFSTGVIGEALPVAAIYNALPSAIDGLVDDGWEAAARAIMTTDTVPKGVSRQLQIDGVTVTVTGIAKGAGMIRPDMATMLAYVACDVALAPDLLQQCLDQAVAGSFNSISVDGDTSTNDACVLIATGRSGLPRIESADSTRFTMLCAAVSEVCSSLAQAIVRDAEGATKFITVVVEQGRSDGECRQVAYTVAHSPLVKTAFFASDPNWGRILAAVGRAGLDDLDVGTVTIFLDEVCIVSAGGRAPDYQEQQGSEVMRRDEISVRILLGRGKCSARIWTSDLSYDYVRINAEYRS